MNEKPISLIQVARSLSVTPGAISNWQKRYEDFPEPVRVDRQRRFYSMSEIQSFMERHDLRPGIAQSLRSDPSDPSTSEGALVDQTIAALARVVPLGVKPLLAVSTLVIVAKEQAGGLTSVNSLIRAVNQLDSAAGELNVGLIVLRALPEQLLTEILVNWQQAAPRIDRGRVSLALRRFLRNSSTRKLGAEFTSSTSIARLIKKITPGLDILDLCCGYGTALREYRRDTRIRVGQEINAEVAALAQALARIEGYEVEILNEDSLAVCHGDWLSNGFHAVIVDPPIGIRSREDQISPTDLRWTHSAVARTSQAEDYWIQSALAYLRPSSIDQPFRAVVVLRTGWFFDGSGGPFRDALLKSGVVEAVISLGPGTKMGTAIPVSILVLRKAGIGAAMVRMIDAQEAGHVHRGVRDLKSEEIDAIAAALKGESTDKSSSTVKVLDVPIQEILQNGSVLDVRRYIDSSSPPVSLKAALSELNKAVDLLSKMFSLVGSLLSDLKPTEILDLESISSTELKMVRLSGSNSQMDLVQSFFKTRRQGEEWTSDDVLADDVVVCLMGTSVGHALSGKDFLAKQSNWSKILIIRITNSRKVIPEYILAWARYGGLEPQTKRLVTGSTVPTIATRDVKQIVLPIVDLDTQMRIVHWGRRLDEFSSKSATLADFEVEFINAAKLMTAAFFGELDRREAKP